MGTSHGFKSLVSTEIEQIRNNCGKIIDFIVYACGTCFEYREGIERGKNLIYCVEKQYLIVLKKEFSHYVIITAYFVCNDKKQAAEIFKYALISIFFKYKHII